jgi:hypothetical protein
LRSFSEQDTEHTEEIGRRTQPLLFARWLLRTFLSGIAAYAVLLSTDHQNSHRGVLCGEKFQRLLIT